jgi:hypothetical protein
MGVPRSSAGFARATCFWGDVRKGGETLQRLVEHGLRVVIEAEDDAGLHGDAAGMDPRPDPEELDSRLDVTYFGAVAGRPAPGRIPPGICRIAKRPSMIGIDNDESDAPGCGAGGRPGLMRAHARRRECHRFPGSSGMIFAAP